MIGKANILACCLLLGALLLTACHDYDGYDNKEIGLSQAERLANADSLFLNLSIVGNSTSVTRASETEGNAIYDGILCIFEGDDAATATLRTATVIDQLVYNPNEPRTVAGGSAASINITQRLANGTHAYGAHLYALALLNTTATGFRVDEATGKLQFKAANVNNYSNLADGTTYSDIQNHTLNSVGSPDEHVGLFMTNTTATGLVEVTPDYHLFDTEDDAATNFSTKHITIPVERVGVRIRVTNDIPAGTLLSNIHLHGNSSINPVIHKMTWALASELPGTDVATGATNFSLFHQHSHESGEAIYVPVNSSATQIVVEVQLKEGSVLLGDCYSFPSLDGNKLYTSTDELVTFFKDNWGWRSGYYPAISSWSADDVFRNTKVTILDDGSVKVSVLTDETINNVTADVRTALGDVENDLSNLTQGYRDGKMYYTYTISSLERNNAYNLSLVEQGTTDTRHVAVTFKFDQGGSGQTATYNNGCSDLFTSSRVVLGSNLNYDGRDAGFGQTKINPTTQHSSPDASDNIDFLFTPVSGWTFTPSSVSFNTTRYGTDGGKVDVYWLNSDNTTQSLGTEIVPYRNNQVVNVLNWSQSFTAGNCDADCGLRLFLYSLKNDKSVGFSDVIIRGTLTSSETISDPQKSIGGVGRPTP